MPLKFYFHPLASFCHKALIALYENDTPFEPVVLDLMDETVRENYRAVSPMLKMPALVDEERGRTVLESTTVVEYLDRFHPGPVSLIPADPDAAVEARQLDRTYDNYVHHPMQKIVTDRLRPQDRRDTFGVEQAKDDLRAAYAALEPEMAGRQWALGEAFTLADCAAAPALFYANTAVPFGGDFPGLAAYLGRLMARESFARALAEAEPFFDMFPLEKKPTLTPPDINPTNKEGSP